MANVFRRARPEYLISVNTPDFPAVDWAINPNVAAATPRPVRYWFLTGAIDALGFEIVELVDAAARAAIDAALLAARVAANKDADKREFDDRRVLRALTEVVRREVNPLRAQHGLHARTFAELRDALRIAIDTGP